MNVTEVTNPEEKKVFVRRVRFTLGAMGTEQIQESESFYIADFIGKDSVQLILLDYQDKVTAVRLDLTMEELKDDYTYVPDYFAKKKTPKDIDEAKHVATGNKHLKNKEFFSAEFEFDKAIEANPTSVRGTYGKGKALLERGDEKEAFQVFEKLADFKELYGKEFKHTFNSLGIDLRRLDKIGEAVRNYKRALYMDSSDEILHYNIAHAYYKNNQINEAKKHLKAAMRLRPDFKEGQKFLDALNKKHG